jgi:hypothetical protein
VKRQKTICGALLNEYSACVACKSKVDCVDDLIGCCTKCDVSQLYVQLV